MELNVLLSLADLIGFQKGYTISEIGELNARAKQLWERLGRPPEGAGVVYCQLNDLLHRSETQRMLDVTGELLHTSQGQEHARARGTGHIYAGAARMLRGELAEALSHLEEGLREYCDASDIWDLENHIFAADRGFGITAQTWLGFVRCWLGYSDKALVHFSAAVEQSRWGSDVGRIIEALTKRAVTSAEVV